MIKKIDANKYGVVKYAITSVDELNRLPKKIAPSSQAILIENGLKVFVYGDGQWVEEVVDGDLSENMQSIVADYERSKMGYDGVKRGSLEERLKDDFQGIYDILNARDYCEYSGRELKVDNTWMGNQIDTRVEGRTLQNLVDGKNMIVDASDHTTRTISLRANLLKTNTIYTFIFNVKRNTLTAPLRSSAFEGELLPTVITFVEVGQTGIIKKVVTTTNTIKPSIGLSTNNVTGIESGAQKIEFDLMILEGDYTQTPLSELPYFEGIESVGEREIGKNLFDGVLEVGSYDVNGTPAGGVHAVRSKNYIEIDPNKQYCISLKDYSNYFYIHCYDKDKKNIGEVSMKSNFKPLEGCKYITFNTYNGVTSDLNSPIQLEEGTQATAYEPFGYKIKGKSCGKNLFDIKKWHGAICVDSTPIEITEDGKVIMYGKSDDAYPHTGATGSAVCREEERKHLLPIRSNTTYSLSMKCEGEYNATNYIQFYDENYNSLGLIGHGTSTGFKRTFKTPTEAKFLGIRVGIKNGIGGSLCYSDIQLEESSEPTSYEPYQESTYSIHSPIPLRSLPNGVCDVYDFESGAVIQKVGKIVLDGSENWEKTNRDDQTINNTTVFHTSDYDDIIIGETENLELICDNYPSLYRTWSGEYEGVAIEGDSYILRIRINLDRLSTQDVDGFKQWLQANPMTIYCELKEPIIHYLTPSQLKSFEGTTHVISENTLIPTTTTKILTDTYANVSNVNSTAYSLRRGINDVAETSAIINETDIEQDDVLDVTMCAIDELYSMLEPNLE